MYFKLTAAAGLCLITSVALADRPAADKCAAGLNTNGKAIYSASAPQVAPGADLRSIVTANTQALVKSGAVSMGDARPAAEAAGKCLAMINS
ncbi:hypothetical protein ABLE91_15065 [Aquabacter sp. CN5-332]|uniref:hypothetical protein n=1 Tax=Aquabacter sp. CN5-332 TaxID=3156608 RepID=UPI0032B3ED9B